MTPPTPEYKAGWRQAMKDVVQTLLSEAGRYENVGATGAHACREMAAFFTRQLEAHERSGP